MEDLSTDACCTILQPCQQPEPAAGLRDTSNCTNISEQTHSPSPTPGTVHPKDLQETPPVGLCILTSLVSVSQKFCNLSENMSCDKTKVALSSRQENSDTLMPADVCTPVDKVPDSIITRMLNGHSEGSKAYRNDASQELFEADLCEDSGNITDSHGVVVDETDIRRFVFSNSPIDTIPTTENKAYGEPEVPTNHINLFTTESNPADKEFNLLSLLTATDEQHQKTIYGHLLVSEVSGKLDEENSDDVNSDETCIVPSPKQVTIPVLDLIDEDGVSVVPSSGQPMPNADIGSTTKNAVVNNITERESLGGITSDLEINKCTAADVRPYSPHPPQEFDSKIKLVETETVAPKIAEMLEIGLAAEISMSGTADNLNCVDSVTLRADCTNQIYDDRDLQTAEVTLTQTVSCKNPLAVVSLVAAADNTQDKIDAKMISSTDLPRTNRFHLRGQGHQEFLLSAILAVSEPNADSTTSTHQTGKHLEDIDGPCEASVDKDEQISSPRSRSSGISVVCDSCSAPSARCANDSQEGNLFDDSSSEKSLSPEMSLSYSTITTNSAEYETETNCVPIKIDDVKSAINISIAGSAISQCLKEVRDSVDEMFLPQIKSCSVSHGERLKAPVTQVVTVPDFSAFPNVPSSNVELLVSHPTQCIEATTISSNSSSPLLASEKKQTYPESVPAPAASAVATTAMMEPSEMLAMAIQGGRRISESLHNELDNNASPRVVETCDVPMPPVSSIRATTTIFPVVEPMLPAVSNAPNVQEDCLCTGVIEENDIDLLLGVGLGRASESLCAEFDSGKENCKYAAAGDRADYFHQSSLTLTESALHQTGSCGLKEVFQLMPLHDSEIADDFEISSSYGMIASQNCWQFQQQLRGAHPVLITHLPAVTDESQDGMTRKENHFDLGQEKSSSTIDEGIRNSCLPLKDGVIDQDSSVGSMESTAQRHVATTNSTKCSLTSEGNKVDINEQQQHAEFDVSLLDQKLDDINKGNNRDVVTEVQVDSGTSDNELQAAELLMEEIDMDGITGEFQSGVADKFLPSGAEKFSGSNDQVLEADANMVCEDGSIDGIANVGSDKVTWSGDAEFEQTMQQIAASCDVASSSSQQFESILDVEPITLAMQQSEPYSEPISWSSENENNNPNVKNNDGFSDSQTDQNLPVISTAISETLSTDLATEDANESTLTKASMPEDEGCVCVPVADGDAELCQRTPDGKMVVVEQDGVDTSAASCSVVDYAVNLAVASTDVVIPVNVSVVSEDTLNGNRVLDPGNKNISSSCVDICSRNRNASMTQYNDEEKCSELNTAVAPFASGDRCMPHSQTSRPSPGSPGILDGVEVVTEEQCSGSGILPQLETIDSESLPTFYGVDVVSHPSQLEQNLTYEIDSCVMKSDGSVSNSVVVDETSTDARPKTGWNSSGTEKDAGAGEIERTDARHDNELLCDEGTKTAECNSPLRTPNQRLPPSVAISNRKETLLDANNSSFFSSQLHSVHSPTCQSFSPYFPCNKNEIEEHICTIYDDPGTVKVLANAEMADPSTLFASLESLPGQSVAGPDFIGIPADVNGQAEICSIEDDSLQGQGACPDGTCINDEGKHSRDSESDQTFELQKEAEVSAGCENNHSFVDAGIPDGHPIEQITSAESCGLPQNEDNGDISLNSKPSRNISSSDQTCSVTSDDMFSSAIDVRSALMLLSSIACRMADSVRCDSSRSSAAVTAVVSNVQVPGTLKRHQTQSAVASSYQQMDVNNTAADNAYSADDIASYSVAKSSEHIVPCLQDRDFPPWVEKLLELPMFGKDGKPAHHEAMERDRDLGKHWQSKGHFDPFESNDFCEVLDLSTVATSSRRGLIDADAGMPLPCTFRDMEQCDQAVPSNDPEMEISNCHTTNQVHQAGIRSVENGDASKAKCSTKTSIEPAEPEVEVSRVRALEILQNISSSSQMTDLRKNQNELRSNKRSVDCAERTANGGRVCEQMLDEDGLHNNQHDEHIYDEPPAKRQRSEAASKLSETEADAAAEDDEEHSDHDAMPRHAGSSYRWRYPLQLLDLDDEPIVPVIEARVVPEIIPPLHTCPKPLRLGLSRRKYIPALHPYLRRKTSRR